MNDGNVTLRAQQIRGLMGRSRWSFVALVVGLFIGRFVLTPNSSSPVVPELSHGQGDHGKVAATWTCSMHPQVQAPEPGACPICRMELIPVPSNIPNGGDSGNHDRVELSERAKVLSRLQTSEVRRPAAATVEVRLLGRVEEDESRLRNVTVWTGGRIDRLHVKVTGKRLRTGQIVATLYSPEVLAAHQDLIIAKRHVGSTSEGAGASTSIAEATLTAARERLRLLGVPKRALSAMESADKPTEAVAIRSPFSGTVIERLAIEGAYVKTGTPLYRLADLTHLWVQLDAYESDLAQISVGQKVNLAVQALPEDTFQGQVTFVDPTLDAARRTAQVRVEVDNREGRLRPGMFVEATVSVQPVAGSGRPLVVPATAPLFTGRRAIVYVEREVEGRIGYEPKTVRLGPRLGDTYPVVAGLSEGQRVVSRGAFALDADLQIRGGRSMMAAADDRTPDGADVPIAMPAVELAKFAPLILTYLEIQRSLAADDLAAAKAAGGYMAKTLIGIKFTNFRTATDVWRTLAAKLSEQATQVYGAVDLEQARAAFEGLSRDIATVLRVFGNPLKKPVHMAFCPMAMGSDGAAWLQEGTAIDNAYFGASMRACGEVTDTLAPGEHLGASRRKGTSR